MTVKGQRTRRGYRLSDAPVFQSVFAALAGHGVSCKRQDRARKAWCGRRLTRAVYLHESCAGSVMGMTRRFIEIEHGNHAGIDALEMRRPLVASLRGESGGEVLMELRPA